MYPRLLQAGEQGLVVEFGDAIDPALNQRVVELAASLSNEKLGGILEIVPTYRSLMVYFDPLVAPRDKLGASILQRLSKGASTEPPNAPAMIVEIPVCYGGDFGPDLDYVATRAGLAIDKVVALHCSRPYRIYMLGFMPGFPYLGGLPKEIATPRLDSPRTKVPAGSVGIAGDQTGFYPVESPGGWRIIGRTPLALGAEDFLQAPLYAPGDHIRFTSIDRAEYERLAKARL